MSKTLRIIGHNLGINVTLMLTFAPGAVCWRVIKLGKANHVGGQATYSSNTAFLVPQIDPDNIVFAGTWQECAIGEKCDLTEEEGFLQFTTPVPGDEGFFQCTNKTSAPTGLGIGFYVNDDIIPLAIWKGITNDSVLKAMPPLTLSIYSTSAYKESELITGEIQSPKLWEGNLGSLVEDVTTLTVSVDPSTMEISINPK